MTKLIEMEYKSLLNKKPELLYNGEYDGYEYYITSMGSHPCAYIIIEPDDDLFGKSCDELSIIPAHGGINYATTSLGDWVKDKWVIGWDYMRYGDYNGFTGEIEMEFGRELKKWSTEEIMEDIIKNINFINSLKK